MAVSHDGRDLAVARTFGRGAHPRNHMNRTLIYAALTFLAACDPAVEPPTTAPQTASQTIAEPAEVPEFDDRTLPFHASGPVATVNGEDVSAEAFNEAARRFGKMAKYLDKARITRYKERILTEIIRDHLTGQVLRDAKVDVSDEAVEAKFAEYLKQNFRSEEDVDEYYQRTGMSPERIRADIRKSLALEEYLDQKYQTAVSDEEVRTYYDENTSRFSASAEVHAAHILLAMPRSAPPEEVKEKKKEAQKLARKARKVDADFAALAREHSSGPRADKGGDLGWFAERQMVPEFSNAAFKLAVGEVSDPVRSSHGFHVIKVFERREERIKPFEEAAPEIRSSLSRSRKRDASIKFMQDVRTKAKIVQHPENIVDNPNFETKPPKFPGRDIAAGLEAPTFEKKAAATPK